MRRSSLKRRLYLAVAATSFLFRNWTIRKKLYIGFASLILVLALNVVLTIFEVSRLEVAQSKLSYLIYLDLLGIVTGCLFIWIISQSVLRPMKRMVQQLESKNNSENLRYYLNDEIGQLARAVSYVKKTQNFQKPTTDEKKLLLEAILHASMERIFVFDQLGTLTSASRGFKVITGLKQNHPIDLKLSEVFHNLNLENALDDLSDQSKEISFYEQRVTFKSRSGKTQRINCSICKVKGVDSDMYIGILKELNTSARMKETLKRTLSPFSKNKTLA